MDATTFRAKGHGRCWWDFTAQTWVCGPRCDRVDHPGWTGPAEVRGRASVTTVDPLALPPSSVAA